MPLYGQWSGSPRRFNALSCFNVRLRLARAARYLCGHVVASRVPIPKARPPAADQRRRRPYNMHATWNAQIACRKKPRLSRGFEGPGGSRTRHLRGDLQGESDDLRCALSALTSPGSLVLVQTAQVVTETLVPARAISAAG
jgi:hypothetical protein